MPRRAEYHSFEYATIQCTFLRENSGKNLYFTYLGATESSWFNTCHYILLKFTNFLLTKVMLRIII